MASIEDIVAKMRRNSKGVRFKDPCKVCDHYFGHPRKRWTSHRVYKMPWVGDPRVNIQEAGGKAKAYQVRQVLSAVERIERIETSDDEGRRSIHVPDNLV